MWTVFTPAGRRHHEVTGGRPGVTEVDASDVRWIPLSQIDALPHVDLVDVGIRALVTT